MNTLKAILIVFGGFTIITINAVAMCTWEPYGVGLCVAAITYLLCVIVGCVKEIIELS